MSPTPESPRSTKHLDELSEIVTGRRETGAELEIPTIVARILNGDADSTPRITAIFRTASDFDACIRLIYAFDILSSQQFDVAMAACLPGLIHVAHRCLTTEGLVKNGTLGRLACVLDRAADGLRSAPVLRCRFAADADDKTRAALVEIVRAARVESAAYWACAELLAIVEPSTDTLRVIAAALDPELSKLDDKLANRIDKRLARVIEPIARGHWSSLFDIGVLENARASADGRLADPSGVLVRRMILALSQFAGDHVEELRTSALSSDTAALRLVLTVCSNAGIAKSPELSPEARVALTSVLRDAMTLLEYYETTNPESLRAQAVHTLGFISSSHEDLAILAAFIRNAIQEGRVEFLPRIGYSFAQLASCALGDLGRTAANPIPPLAAPDLPDPVDRAHSRGRSSVESLPVIDDTKLVDCAFDLADCRDDDEIRELGRALTTIVQSGALHARPHDSSCPFVGLRQMSDFADNFECLLSLGYVEACAALVPELLSISEGTERARMRKSMAPRATKILERVASCLSELAPHMLVSADVRRLATSRLSGADRHFLETAHLPRAQDFNEEFLPMAGAVLEFRAAEGDSAWLEALLEMQEQCISREEETFTFDDIADLVQFARTSDPRAPFRLLKLTSMALHGVEPILAVASALGDGVRNRFGSIPDYFFAASSDERMKGMILVQALSLSMTQRQIAILKRAAYLLAEQDNEEGCTALATVGALGNTFGDVECLMTMFEQSKEMSARYRVTVARAAAAVIDRASADKQRKSQT